MPLSIHCCPFVDDTPAQPAQSYEPEPSYDEAAAEEPQGEPLYEAADGSVPAETGGGGGEGLRATALYDYQAGR